MSMGIYKIENMVNGKVYIGSSKDIKQRFRQHLSDLKNNRHHSIHLQRAWNKYGESNFKFSIIEELDYINDLFITERHYIIKFDSLNKNKGYNIKPIFVEKSLNNNIIQKLVTSKIIDLLELGVLAILIRYISNDGTLIYQERPLNQKDIIKMTKLGRSKLSLILNHLQEVNLISKLTSKKDQRKNYYVLNVDMAN